MWEGAEIKEQTGKNKEVIQGPYLSINIYDCDISMSSECPEYTKPFEEWAALPCSYHLFICTKTEKQPIALSYFACLTANTYMCETLQLCKQGLLWLSCWKLKVLVIMMQSSRIKHNCKENSPSLWFVLQKKSEFKWRLTSCSP